MATDVDEQAASEITLEAEELEEVITPIVTNNHNHNETLVSDEV